MAWSGRFDDFNNYNGNNNAGNSSSNQKWSSTGRQTSSVPATQMKICEITPDAHNVNIIGIILTKEGPRSIITKKGTECHLLAFLLRDSPDAFINCTCWGNEQFIQNLAQSIKIGDVVEVKNAQAQQKPDNSADDRFRAWTPSGFQLSLSENHSSVTLYTGRDLHTYTGLRHVPAKPSNDFYTLEDVNVNGTALQGEHVNLLVAIKQVWPAREITTKTGKRTRKCDVVLCDETCSNFILTLWDNYVDLASTWKARQTIIFAADVKIQYNDYKGCMSATADSKTIITSDPDTPEGHILYQFMRTQSDFGSSFLADTDNDEQDPDLSSIKTVLTVQEVKQWQDATCQQQRSVDYAVLYGFLTTFDIDGDTSAVFRQICKQCRKEVKADAGYICTNDQCIGGDPTDINGPGVEYNITVSVSDHTGTLKFCHLEGTAAEEVLGCKAQDFQNFDVQRKTEKKWSCLLERCRVILKMKKIVGDFSNKTTLRILSLTKASPREIMQRAG